MKTKSILSYFAATITAITMSMSFTSCNSSDDFVEQAEIQAQTETQVQKTRSVYFVTVQSVINAANMQFEIRDGKETAMMDVNTMKLGTYNEMPEYIKKGATSMIKSFLSESDGQTVDEALKDLRFAKIDLKYDGLNIKITPQITLKEGYTPAADLLNVFTGWYYTSPKSPTTDKEYFTTIETRFYEGLQPDKEFMATFLEVLNSTMVY